VPLAIDLFRYMAGWATKIEGETIPISVPVAGVDGTRFCAYTRREPVGVVGQIIPWNFPLLMAAWKLGPALAAGCTVVLKPAEQTPLSALRLGELVQEASFPDGVVNIVPGYGGNAGAALAVHPGVDKVAFTGSTEVGKLIVQVAAGNLKRVTLELGGKSPAIVFDDADLDVTIPGVAQAIFFNHGQCCCAGSRLYINKKVFDTVVEGVANEAKKIRLGHAFDPEATMGPLVHKSSWIAFLATSRLASRKGGSRSLVDSATGTVATSSCQPCSLARMSPRGSCRKKSLGQYYAQRHLMALMTSCAEPITRSTVSQRACGRVISGKLMQSLTGCAMVLSGSIATMSSMQRYHLEDTSNQAGAVRWATTSCRTTPRSKRWWWRSNTCLSHSAPTLVVGTGIARAHIF